MMLSKSDTQSLLLLPVAAASSETGISSLPPVSRHVAFRRDEHREVCPSFYAVHRSLRKIINGAGWGESRAPRARSKNIRCASCTEVAWNGSGHASRTLAGEEHLQSDVSGLSARIISGDTFTILYS